MEKNPNLVNFTEDTVRRICDLTDQLLARQISAEIGKEIIVTTDRLQTAI